MVGIDISHWNKTIGIDNPDIDFVICKATEGATYRDKCFDDFMMAAINCGKLVGAYHFMSVTSSPVAQANNYINRIRPYLGEAILVLDYEGRCGEKLAGSNGALEFLNYVYEKTGVKPLIYMNKYYLRKYNWSEVANGDYGLWLADYIDSEITLNDKVAKSKNIKPWTVQAIRQYTSTGFIKNYGGYVDLNKAYMTREAWYKYAEVRGIE